MTQFTPGTLVTLRGRDWVVLPSNDKDILRIKPLGGSDIEETAVYLPLSLPEEQPQKTEFPAPNPKYYGNLNSAKTLFNAARFSFRNVAGPFRCIGKLSFRPHPYQFVPLIMALRQQTVRLFIADDVGVGKTIEALLVARELLDRGEIRSLAVIAPPHLCEQWQTELMDKFSINAVVVRSSTVGQLERKIRGDGSVFNEYPFMVISIDYIKSEVNKAKFLIDVPDLIIVDEVHTAAANQSGQQRHELLRAIAAKEKQNIVLLSATPHSGVQEQFQSLIGLLRPEFATVDISVAGENERRKLARHLVIRRREDIISWHEETIFPARKSTEISYQLTRDYLEVLHELVAFARSVIDESKGTWRTTKFKYFAALSLLRGIMSSPRAGLAMLAKKDIKSEESETQEDAGLGESNPVADKNEQDSDSLPVLHVSKAQLTGKQQQLLESISKKVKGIKALSQDPKAEAALTILNKWINKHRNPVVFCRYIETAKYFGEVVQKQFGDGTKVLVITGEMVDEERKAAIDQLDDYTGKRILVATDCLSEGINLQKHFNAVLHYDLPWNPNRLEQREGRVDRFGQAATEVETVMLYGSNNSVDAVVLNVLLRRARQIKESTGISVPFPEDSQDIMDSILQAVIAGTVRIQEGAGQLSLEFSDDNAEKADAQLEEFINQAAEKHKRTRSIFAQNSIKAEEIKPEIEKIDLAVGKPADVEQFLLTQLNYHSAHVVKKEHGYEVHTTNLPQMVKMLLSGKEKALITFKSPVPSGYMYIGRNHPLVEQFCRLSLAQAMTQPKEIKASRTTAIPTRAVEKKTVIALYRMRLQIKDTQRNTALIAEEMILWGYRGAIVNKNFLTHEECEHLLTTASVSGSDFTPQRIEREVDSAIKEIATDKDLTTSLVESRAVLLVESHRVFAEMMNKGRYEVAYPVLPPDLLGIYILIPSL